MMIRQFKGTTQERKIENSLLDSDKTYISRMTCKIDAFTHFVLTNNNDPFQAGTIDTQGNIEKIENTLIKTGIERVSNSEMSYQFLSKFITDVNDLTNDAFIDFKVTEDKYERSVKMGKYNCNLSVKPVLFIKDEHSFIKRINCIFELSYGSHFERIRFRLHDKAFIHGNSIWAIEEVNSDFFKTSLKRMFLNANKDLLKTLGYDFKKAREIDEQDYQNLKNIVKMILI